MGNTVTSGSGGGATTTQPKANPGEATPPKPPEPASQSSSDGVNLTADAGQADSGDDTRVNDLLGGMSDWAGEPSGYEVKSGDTLWDIAQANGTDLESLLEANPQFRENPDLIHPGQQVKLPGSGQEAPSGSEPQPGAGEEAPSGGQGYTVQSGDSLSAIAQRHGTDLPTLLEANPQFRANPNLIHAGQQVNLPGAGPAGEPGPGTEATPGGEPAPPSAPSEGGDPIGLAALGYGADGNTINPNTNDTNWYQWCLGWTRRAIESAGGNVPELRAESAQQAYEQALASGKIQHGNPPPGAVIFFPGVADGFGHVGIVNPDGSSYRGTVPPSESATTIGDRAISGLDSIPWMLPSG